MSMECDQVYEPCTCQPWLKRWVNLRLQAVVDGVEFSLLKRGLEQGVVVDRVEWQSCQNYRPRTDFRSETQANPLSQSSGVQLKALFGLLQ